ncbi:MAG TPA: preprotein translocase subunit SecA [Candidatus Saccharimonadia bacterium]|nr:preprotein translocase subunit SecA [Candidatus Saccharimonadia bacterium]
MAYKLITKLLGDPNVREVKRARVLVERVNAEEEGLKKLSDEQLRAKTTEFKERLAGGESLDGLLPEAFAVVREAASRVVGMRHFDVQFVGGIVLHKGKIAEMRTGEGKTLVATAPTYLNALTGKGVHVVTVNDYLASLHGGWMGQVYLALGMTTGIIVHDTAYVYDPEYSSDEHGDERLNHLRPVSRGEAYAADITYGTNNEFGFDYLRDNMVDDLAKMVQRPLHYAIVDEVDSILIDEARTPLIISAPANEATDKYYEFARLAATLTPEKDYTVDEKLKAVSLTDEGVEAIERALGVDNVYEAGRIDDVHHVEQSVRARALYFRDRDYVVRDGEIIIVDEFTGRLMPGRRWSDGLHQAVEAKEKVQIQQESLTLATVTFQNYFRLYEKLSGMTGTAATEAEEFGKIYALDVVTVPTHRPMVRRDLPDRIYKTEDGKFRSVAKEVAAMHAKGQPVLIGTVSIAKNELLGRYLTDLGVPHQILNAKNNEAEAAIVAAAGRRGAVTLATNIAGRGTDIMLEPGVDKLGGLHVLGTERHESRRIDNQLRGRGGRQGDPGSSQFYVSLEDDLMRIFGSERIAGVMDTLGLDDETPIENKLVSRSLESAQKKVEGHNFDTRKQLVEYDDVMNKHREAVYSRRRKALAAETLRDDMLEMMRTEVAAMLRAHTNSRTNEIDHTALREAVASILPVSAELAESLERAHETEVTDLVLEEAVKMYDARTEQFTPSVMRMVERFTYINALDRLWIEHLEAMDSLRSGIGLRAVGQRDPLVEYKREGFRMFKQFMALLDAEIATTIFKVSVTAQAAEAPVETALTRAAEQASTNVEMDGISPPSDGRSRQERRTRPVTAASATKSTNKKRKKRR